MQYTHSNTNAGPAVIDPFRNGLAWLEAENRATAVHRELFRRPTDELEREMMVRPLPAGRVYSLLGLMLGTFPPFVIFCRLFGYGVAQDDAFPNHLEGGLIFLCLMMNLVCALVGYSMGRAFAGPAFRAERGTWSRMIFVLALLGIAWGAITGASGGLFFFGMGAFFGPIFAIPVGIAAFLAFGAMHRLMERGGMIDAKHFLPIAAGITGVISVLIAVR